MRLEQEAPLDRERAPSPQAVQRRVDPLRQHDVDADGRVVGQPAHVGEHRIAELAVLRLVVDRDAELGLVPGALAEVHRAQVVDAEAPGVGDRSLRRVVELAGDHAHREVLGHAPFGPPLGGDGRDVGDDDTRPERPCRRGRSVADAARAATWTAAAGRRLPTGEVVHGAPRQPDCRRAASRGSRRSAG